MSQVTQTGKHRPWLDFVKQQITKANLTSVLSEVVNMFNIGEMVRIDSSYTTQDRKTSEYNGLTLADGCYNEVMIETDYDEDTVELY